MAPTKLPITARVLHIKHGALAPKTDLASCDLPELPVFMSMSGEYDVASPDGQVKGLFFCQNVMTLYSEGNPMGAAYDGQQIFTGTIQGRRGSVSMRARGTHVGDWSTCEWEFVTETATGQLKGISGSGRFKYFCGADTEIMNSIVEGELAVEFA